MRQHRHQVVENTRDFSEEGSDPFGALWNFNIQKLLHCQGETLLVGHHGHIVQTVEVWQCLEVCLVLDQFFGTSVQQSNVRIRSHNFFSIELKNQSQHAVSGRMLRPEVDRVVSDLPVLHILSLSMSLLWGNVGSYFGILRRRRGEIVPNSYQSCCLIRLRAPPRCRCERPCCCRYDKLGRRGCAHTQTLCALAGEPI